MAVGTHVDGLQLPWTFLDVCANRYSAVVMDLCWILTFSVGERLSPYVALACVAMAITILVQ